jgi:hypothetical protein
MAAEEPSRLSLLIVDGMNNHDWTACQIVQATGNNKKPE